LYVEKPLSKLLREVGEFCNSIMGEAGSSSSPTVFVFSSHDISSVQGTTEAHYIAKHLGNSYKTHVFGPLSADLGDTTTHSYSFSGLVGLVMLNIFLLPRWIQLGLRHRPEIIYTYRNAILPPIVLNFLFSSEIVCDLRVHPVKQPKEFNTSSIKNRLLNKFSWAGHKILLQKSAAIITLSNPLKQELINSFSLDQDRIYIVPLAANPEKFRPVRSSGHKLRVAYIGAISSLRGIDSVVESLNRLPKNKQEKISFELFGSADEMYINELIYNRKDGAYNIQWHGLIPHDDIPERVGCCDWAVSPLPPHDGFNVSSPAKIYEYLSMGLPIVATSITPHERILEDGYDSILVDVSDVDAMSAAFAHLLDNETYRRKLSYNARQKGLENSWEKRMEKVDSIINNIK